MIAKIRILIFPIISSESFPVILLVAEAQWDFMKLSVKGLPIDSITRRHKPHCTIESFLPTIP